MSLSIEACIKQQQVVLSGSILLYSDRNHGAVKYASEHDVTVDESGKPTIMAGRPISLAALRNMENLLNVQMAGELLPENVLVNRGGMLVWWKPAGMRRVFFNTKYDGIGKHSAVVPHPALVFIVQHDQWHVFGLKRNKRPNANTALCHAPYMNVWVSQDGRICTGNVNLPGDSLVEKISAWESSFFDSEFTHPNETRRFVKHKEGVIGLSRKLIEGRWKRFPVSVLVESGATVGQMVSKIAEKSA